MQLHLIVQAN